MPPSCPITASGRGSSKNRLPVTSTTIAPSAGQVLPDHPGGAAGQRTGGGQLAQILGHQGHVGGLQGHLAAGDAHGDADIGAGKGCGVVHPVTDEGHPALLGRLIDQLDLVGGQKAGVDLVRREAQPGADAGGTTAAVAGHHQDRGPARPQRRERLAAVSRGSSATVTAPSTRAPRPTRTSVSAPSARAASAGGMVAAHPRQHPRRCRPRPRPSSSVPVMPFAGVRADIADRGRGRCPRSAASRRIAPAMGCSDCASSPASKREEVVLVALQRDDAGHLGPAGGQRAGLVEGKGPTSASPSSAAPPLNSTPPRAAADRADRIAAGTEITTAQGLAATKSVAAR